MMTWTAVGLLLASCPAAAPPDTPGPEAPGARGTVVGAPVARPAAAPEARAAAPVQDTGRFVQGSYTGDEGTRRYRLYVPAAAGEGDPPLVVMLHGCTQDPADFATGTRANRAADETGAVVLYPEQPQEANPTKCWSWYEPASQTRGSGEPAILAGMIRQVLDETGADPDRVFVAGMSAGGAMAQVLAAAYPARVRGLAVHSAPAYGSATDVPSAMAVLQQGDADPGTLPGRVLEAMGDRARAIPMVVIHGAADPVVRPVNAEQVLRQWAGVATAASGAGATDPAGARAGGDRDAAGARDAGETCPALPGLEAEASRFGDGTSALRCAYDGATVPLEYWRVDGVGHAWSGGSADGTYTDPAGPDVTFRIFDFFLGTADRR